MNQSNSLESFIKQLAKDNNVKRFSIVTDNASLPPSNVKKRHSAPPAINAATRELLSSFDEAPRYPSRRSTSINLTDQYDMGSIFDEVMEIVFDEVDNTLYEVAECEEEENEEDQESSNSQLSAKVLHTSQEEEPDIDFSFQRFTSVQERGDSQEPCKGFMSLPHQMLAAPPRAPIRRESLEFFSSSDTSRLSSSSISSTWDENAPTPPHSPSNTQLRQHQEHAKLDYKEHEPDIIPDSTSIKCGRRKRRQSLRRSSLDTGVTFRNSFNSQDNDRVEESPSR